MIKLFADTASNLPVALNKKYNVNIIPLSYTKDGENVPYDLEHDFDGKAFYDAMRNGAEMKTSMANSETFRASFEEAVKNGDEKIETGLKKFGAMLGDFVEVGCNSVLNPGTVIGRHSNVYPTSCVRGMIPENSIWKNTGAVVKKI